MPVQQELLAQPPSLCQRGCTGELANGTVKTHNARAIRATPIRMIAGVGPTDDGSRTLKLAT